MIAEEIGELPGKRFAVIVDEAHSSQSGESTKSLKAVLSARGALEEAEAEEAKAATPEEELESTILAEMDKRGRLPNLSTFAFTATPKPKTLELFGTKRADGKFDALPPLQHAAGDRGGLHPRRARQLHDLQGLLAAAQEDRGRPALRQEEGRVPAQVVRRAAPARDRREGRRSGRALRRKVQGEIGGKAKAMIVTRSRLHAVRYKLAVDKYLAEKGYPFKALVAFSGTVQDGGQSLHRVRHERLSGNADRARPSSSPSTAS